MVVFIELYLMCISIINGCLAKMALTESHCGLTDIVLLAFVFFLCLCSDALISDKMI